MAGGPAVGGAEPEAYGHQVRGFVAWLGDRSPVDGDPLVDEAARDCAARDYKRHLKKVERWKPSSVNLALAALDSFYGYLGLGRPVVRREELPGRAPRALSLEDQRRLLRSAERVSARDRAIVVCCCTRGCGLRSLLRSMSARCGHRRGRGS